MNNFNLNKPLTSFTDNQYAKFQNNNPKTNESNDVHIQDAKNPLMPNHIKNETKGEFLNNRSMPTSTLTLKMNVLAELERSLFVKDLMKFPKEMQELLNMLQNTEEAAGDLPKLLRQNISLSQLTELMQQNGKEAMNKLMNLMSMATKQGITDLSEIKEAIKLINASISASSQENPQQVVKTFMLMYLPWLPLHEGVDFKLEFEKSEDDSEDSDISVTLLISTRNYGNVKAVLTLIAGNSLNVFINCDEKFPKEELLKRIKEESNRHTVQSDVIFEQNKSLKQENAALQAKISMSQLTKVNPFLLLMANAVIKNVIDLDNLA